MPGLNEQAPREYKPVTTLKIGDTFRSLMLTGEFKILEIVNQTDGEITLKCKNLTSNKEEIVSLELKDQVSIVK